jgi:hypothetical protein
MFIATQCTDDRTGQLGSFGFTHGRRIDGRMRFYSLTPVFDSLVGLFTYCRENNIELDHSTPTSILETGTNTLVDC